MSAVAGILLEGKQKTSYVKRSNKSPCRQPQKKTTKILTQDVLEQLVEAFYKVPCVALAVDESTDVYDNSKLLVYVRFFNRAKKEFFEGLLGVLCL